MQAVQVQHYIRRADDFFEGMKLMRGEEFYWNSAALLAIHSALSYTDALRVGLGDRKLASDDHKKAISALKRLASGRLDDQAGFTLLGHLLSSKSLVAYGDQRMTRKELNNLVLKAEQFAKWASNAGRQLNLEGWQDDDQ